jgi:hypothetical protein
MEISKKLLKIDTKVLLSTLWLFTLLNYLYCDLLGLMDPNLLRQYLSGTVNGMHINQGFLLSAAILMEIPIVLVLLSRILKYKVNRLVNLIGGIFMTLVQVATLFIGDSTNYYFFFSIIEISTTILIVWTAWKWTKPNHE